MSVTARVTGRDAQMDKMLEMSRRERVTWCRELKMGVNVVSVTFKAPKERSDVH
jgi:hypothetical protein